MSITDRLVGQFPFTATDKQTLLHQNMRGEINYSLLEKQKLPHEVVDLVNKMLTMKASYRPYASALLSHPSFSLILSPGQIIKSVQAHSSDNSFRTIEDKYPPIICIVGSSL